MADKTITITHGSAPSLSQVTTSGSIAVNTILVAYDDATPPMILAELWEKAKINMLNHQLAGKP